MPRWASRITLEVTGIRVERLREISEEDAIAEGVRIGMGAMPYFSCLDAFKALWDSINGKRPGCSWEANPWVWPVEFRRVEE
ncbi:MAG: hypothetical protein LBV12_02765 [Puniceicoccales bacterium]|nr:hypothetical protein [Puniceicoccales bacterium]